MSKRGGVAPRRKGSSFERGVVELLKERGIDAERVPLSGAVKTSRFDHDIYAVIRDIARKIECKRRKRAFATIDGMPADNYALALCTRRAEYRAVALPC